ncbi:hypothetical protein [Halorubrum persicum]|uniref:hypothetical protein n=1 Tax=Halorubrum persicum TaxID=1383844 RepID=UPI001181B365|nr:hypothetical protein [Halorubrum persicum]
MKQSPGRRSFLAMTGTSASVALAGCSGPTTQSQTEGDEGTTADGDEGAAPEGEATLTVQVQGDQEALSSFQEELQTELENGNITRTEAQEELQSRQEELITNATTTFEDSVENADAVTIDNAAPEDGLLRLTAPATTFVNGLEDGDLAAVLPGEYYDQYLQQQQIEEAVDQATNQENNTTSS